MKRFNYILGMLAVAATFTACSSDDVVQKNDDGIADKAYMAVSIVSNNAGTRATDTGSTDFDKNNSTENAISSATFFLYDNAGNFLAKGETVSTFTAGTTDHTGHTTTDNDAAVYNAVVSFVTDNKSTAESAKQILAVVNSDAQTVSNLQNKTLTEAKELFTSSLYSGAAGSESNFVMTNSVYVDNGSVKVATDIPESTSSKSYIVTASDATAALEKLTPVDIHVERLAAKVNVVNNITADNTSFGTPSIDGTSNPTLTVEILGCGITATEPTSYLFKSIQNKDYFSNAAIWNGTSVSTTDGAWNEAKNFRCYWAESPNYSTAAGSYPTNDYVEDNPKVLNYITYNDVTALSNNQATYYCPERTYSDGDGLFTKYKSISTSVLVLAKLKVNGEEKDLVSFNGTLYTVDSYKALVCAYKEASVYYTYDETNKKYIQIDDTDLEIPEKSLVVTDENGTTTNLVDGKVACQLTATAKAKDWYKKTGEDYTKTTSNIINTALAQETLQGSGFKGGRMYYSIPIKHLVDRADNDDVTTPTAIGQYGVVRNHIYRIELSGISGIGHAIWNPDEHIVPTESTTYYMSAKMYVLSWRIVPTQKVVLK